MSRDTTGSGNLTHCDECRAVFNMEDDRREFCSECPVCPLCFSSDHFCTGSFFRSVKRFSLPEFNHLDRLTGTEIEIIDSHFSSDKEMWSRRAQLFKAIPEEMGISHDSSVNGDQTQGFELVTPPIPESRYSDYVGDVVNSIKKYGFDINKTCGLHVHFDARDLVKNPKNISQVLRTVYSIEDIILSMNPPSRWDNKYCVSLSKNYLFDDFAKPMPVEAFENYWYSIGDYRYRNLSKSDIESMKGSKYGHAKYSGINFHSMMHRGTIEFRYHAGTLQTDKIVNWMRFLSKLLNYGVYEFDDEKVVELYSMPTTIRKFEKMIEYFNIPKDLASYMKERVKKFNDKFLQNSWDLRHEADTLKKTIAREREMRKRRASLGMSGGIFIDNSPDIGPQGLESLLNQSPAQAQQWTIMRSEQLRGLQEAPQITPEQLEYDYEAELARMTANRMPIYGDAVRSSSSFLFNTHEDDGDDDGS